MHRWDVYRGRAKDDNQNERLFQLVNPVFPADFDFEPPTAGYISPSRRRGFKSERLVEIALCRMEERDYGLGAPIIGHVHARPNDDLDRNQVDFSVKVRENLDILLQVKSSREKKSRFEKKMNKLGRLIMAVVVRAKDPIEYVIRKVVKAIKLALNKIQRKIERKAAAEHARKKSYWEERCYRFHFPRMCH
jgi:hypothetical protein